ncbi:MAG: hypothetical protein JOZ22_24605, partial [Acidobacteriia bacterium]|nr:hypothetical protein [Terriglobia bacterium]
APSVAGFTGTNPTTPAVHNNPNGGLSGGYGYVNYINGGCEQPGGAGVGNGFGAAFGTSSGCPGPRTGQAVIRLTF